MILLVRTAAQRNGPETRREILTLLAHEQGLTKSQICRRLRLAWGTVAHHTRVLEREGLLVRRRAYGFARFYTQDAKGPELTLMPLLRESLVPHLLQRIEATPGIGIQALSRELGLGRKVVRRQLESMVEAGLLERSDDYRPKFFVLDRGRAHVPRNEARDSGPQPPSKADDMMHA